MKAVVDPETCMACELCVDRCPEVFEIMDDAARAARDEVPEGEEDCALQAAEECPV